MSEITPQTVSNYGVVFEACPEPCGIVEGDLIVATNAAFRAQFGEAPGSLRSCIDAVDQGRIPLELGMAAKFIARPASGVMAGKSVQWTAWPIGDGRACVRMDGPASPLPEIPEALAPELRQAQALFSAVAEMPVTVWAMEPDGTCTLSVGKGLRHFGLQSGALVGKNLFDVYAKNPQTLDHLRRALQGEHIASETRIGDMTWFSTLLPVRDRLDQKVTQVYGVAENVTERSNAQRHIEEQLKIIKDQQEAIAALTSPIIEVWQGVLVVPLIGSLDGDRAARLLEHLLAEVVGRQSRAVILDLTGTSVADPSTAQHLFDIMRSVRLLGAEGLVSGIRPNVAKTLVELDVASTAWKTFPTLAEALRRLLGKRLPTR
jgi:PAS domain S-box-containing protein